MIHRHVMQRILILCAILIIVFFAGLNRDFLQDSQSAETFPQDTQSVLVIEENYREPKQKVRFVGDIMLARHVERLMDAYGYKYPFQLLPKHATDAYLVGNFEASIPQEHITTKDMHFAFSVKSEYVWGLSEYGFTHLNLANNHSYDFGKSEFEHTNAILLSASTTPFGSPDNQTSRAVSVIEIENTTIALIGLYAVVTVPTDDEIKELIAYASTISDIQIVYVHWGDEYILTHNNTQEKLAYTLIDAGVEAVIGHHPHVVQDIEKYKNGLIFYSLGNFIFDQYFSTDVQEGLMLELSLDDNEGLIFELLPITSIGSLSVPRLMTQYEKGRFLQSVAKNSDTEISKMVIEGSLYISL